MFDEERPCCLKYWKGKIYFSDCEISLGLYIICSTIYCSFTTGSGTFFITAVLASTSTAVHLKIMHHPEPKLGLFRLIFCMYGKPFFLVDILSTFVAAPCSRTIRNITCLSKSVQHGIKSRRYPVFVESVRVVFLSNRTPVVSLLISSQ